ncbi:uncharacterized protein LOC133791181 [Humulus lupulus]|uniref:uncharacterized protein LOC133791181 n=1 Tax=Humulus lupulus TaxID=3486 RepID=UPI002B4070CA|nr:uncharacterized protein LOC133791181 [Humulus lupulus]
MPFTMKIQPIDYHTQAEEPTRLIEPAKPVVKTSRFKRLFERQFTSVLRLSAPAPLVEKAGSGDEPHFIKEANNNGSGELQFEPSSVCLAKMVQNFIEGGGGNEKQFSAPKCGRSRCNCFNGSCNDGSEDDLDLFNGIGHDSNFFNSGEGCEALKGLVLCSSVSERNLLADTARIVDRNKICKRKDEICRTIVTDGLLALGYDASICKSRWEKSPSYPAGEYEYIDVIIDGERLIIDVDFRSEFEIARPTKTYKTILQTLPYIFIGKADRLQRIIPVVAEAAKQSLKKKGMPVPPWRKADYIKAKWLSSHTRNAPPCCGGESGPSYRCCNSVDKKTESGEVDEEKSKALKEWIVVPRQHIGFGVKKKVTGLASVMADEP